MSMIQLRRLSALVAIAVLAGLLPLRATLMKLTDKEGRSIDADVISLDDGQLKIKRSDGMFFDLPVSMLSDEDQKKVTAWAAAEAAREAALPLPANAFDLMVSRTNFDTRKSSREVKLLITYTDGTTSTETRRERSVDEQWGYGITVTNRLLKPVSGLRVEYRLYTKRGNQPAVATKGTLQIGTLKTREKRLLKTTALPYSYSYYQGDPIPKNTQADIYGIWLRIYRGDTLEKEYATPESLMVKEGW